MDWARFGRGTSSSFVVVVDPGLGRTTFLELHPLAPSVCLSFVSRSSLLPLPVLLAGSVSLARRAKRSPRRRRPVTFPEREELDVERAWGWRGGDGGQGRVPALVVVAVVGGW